MKMTNQTILITGGSSGIGLELARQLIKQGNTVIICGRSAERLSEAKSLIPAVHTFRCDLAIHEDRNSLLEFIRSHNPACNVLINNAAIVHKTDFKTDDNILEKADYEIQTNLMAPIVLSKLFLPLFENRSQSAIVNITTGLVYAPRAVYPIYNATKSGLHAFTQVLRHQLNSSPTKIIEVMMPVVDTPWHKGDVPSIAISPSKAVAEMIRKIENGQEEIRVGKVKILYALSRIAPRLAFRKINNL
jgi:uncharacterized oxidoreductase